MVFIITYDLNTPGKEYNSLYNEIKLLGEVSHPLESTWFVKSTVLKADDISTKLRQHMDDNDLLFVAQINETNRQGWLPKTAWEWLKS
jgi:hypothetical protein